MKSKGEIGLCIAATSIIWFFATGMLAICIPLVDITGSEILPLAVITGAAVGTFAVWHSSDNQLRNSPLPTNSMKELEQRVANLEVICSSQELALHNTIKQLEKDELNPIHVKS